MAVDATMPPPVVSAPGTGTATSNNTASEKTTGIADNFQTFLTLLTTQLQHQNPMDPLDTNQFTQQLVQFAGIEQQLKSNEQLKALVEIEKSAQATNALALDTCCDVAKNVAVDYSTAQQLITTAWNVFFAIVLTVSVFGWTGGKKLVGESYTDAKVKVAEQKTQRAEKKAEKKAARAQEEADGEGLLTRLRHREEEEEQ